MSFQTARRGQGEPVWLSSPLIRSIVRLSVPISRRNITINGDRPSFTQAEVLLVPVLLGW